MGGVPPFATHSLDYNLYVLLLCVVTLSRDALDKFKKTHTFTGFIRFSLPLFYASFLGFLHHQQQAATQRIIRRYYSSLKTPFSATFGNNFSPRRPSSAFYRETERECCTHCFFFVFFCFFLLPPLCFFPLISRSGFFGFCLIFATA